MKPIVRSGADPAPPARRRRSGAGPAVSSPRRELPRTGRWRVWGPVALRAAALVVALLGLAGIGSVVGRASPMDEPTLRRAGLELGALSTQALALVGSGGVGSASAVGSSGLGSGELGSGELGSGGLGNSGSGGPPSSRSAPVEPFDVLRSGACPCACASGTPAARGPEATVSARESTAAGLTAPGSVTSAALAGSAVSPGLASLPGSAAGASARRESRPAPNELPVVLNRADAAELRRLPGVGAKRAEAIVLLRQRLGRFQRARDLLRVKGIGPRTLERMLPHLVLD